MVGRIGGQAMLVLLVAFAGAGGCRRAPPPGPRIVLVTLDVASHALRLRDARTGTVVRDLGTPCLDERPRMVLPSPAGDAVVMHCGKVVYRVPVDGGDKVLLGTMELIGAVSGDGKLVWGTLEDGSFAFLHADGSGHTPIAPGTISVPVPSRAGFVNVVPVTRALTQVVYLPSSGARATPVPLEEGLVPGLPLVSVVPGAPRVVELERGERHVLARIGDDGRAVDLTEADPAFDINAVNATYLVYFDRSRVVRLPLAPGSAPVVVLEPQEVSHLYPKAIDPAARLLVARGDEDPDALVCLDLATGRELGRYRLERDIPFAPLIEVR